MKKDIYQEIIRLRFIVGYLGEQTKPAWWNSSFFSPGSNMFLAPIYPKTAVLAQYHGILEAASKIHDKHIGKGTGVFHLFRLPETIEQELHQVISSSSGMDQFIKDLIGQSHAINALASLGDEENRQAIGPVRIGKRADLGKIDSWRSVASYYQQAFTTHSPVFPYFSEIQETQRQETQRKEGIRMKNVDMQLEGDTLIIKVDLTKTFGLSSSGKSLIIATTEGNQSVSGREDIKVGLNVYTKPK